MTVKTEEFFETAQKSSIVKSAIVSGYFAAWASVMLKSARQPLIGYGELFAGKGRFDDGSESTPLVVLGKALLDPLLRKRLKTFFNDKDAQVISALESNVHGLFGSQTLAYPPRYTNQCVSPEIVEQFSDFRDIPTLLFADPFGYMGISLDLFQQLLKHPKSEAILFFNTNRIKAGVSNDFVREHIDALFGCQRAQAIRELVRPVSGEARERCILDAFAEALKDIGFPYVLRFRFLARDVDRTSHHLIHCSRHPLAEKIMKDVMDRHSLKWFDGVPAFQIPQEDKFGQHMLFTQPEPPVELASELVRSFAGRTLGFDEMFRRHSPGTVYVERNYKDALSYLVDNGKIACDPPAETLRFRQGKRTWPKNVRIKFPAAS